MSTKAEKAHMARVAQIGCIVCLNNGIEDSPAVIHHIRSGQGYSQRADDSETLPLCYPHHDGGVCGVAFHAGRKTWERNFGTERQLLTQVRGILGIAEVAL